MDKNKATPGRASPPRPNYLLVFGALAVSTAIEVALSFAGGPLRTPLLLATSLIKALLVILYFMRLRFESRWFWLIFFLPFLLVVPLLLMITQ